MESEQVVRNSLVVRNRRTCNQSSGGSLRSPFGALEALRAFTAVRPCGPLTSASPTSPASPMRTVCPNGSKFPAAGPVELIGLERWVGTFGAIEAKPRS